MSKLAFLGFQERSIDELIEDPGHGLFLDPGLGKTLIILATLARLREACDAERILVVAPKRVAASTWPDEIAKWEPLIGPLTYQLLTTRSKTIVDANITLINPEALPWLFGKPADNGRTWLPGKWQAWGRSSVPRPDMFYLDELHRFKRASGQRFRTLFRFRDHFMRWQGGTGSPAANGYHDLHGQLKMLDGGAALGRTVTEFRRKYFNAVPGFRNYVDYEIKPGAEPQIEAAIRPRITCLRAEDHLQLPDLVQSTVEIDLPKKAREEYKRMEEEVMLTAPGGDVMFAEEARAAKLRQIAGGHVYTSQSWEENRGQYVQLHREKLKAVRDRLEYIGAPTIVVYEFKHDCREMLSFLGKTFGNIPVLGGVTSDDDAVRFIRGWNAGKYRVMLMYPAEGLNLQAGGHNLIWYTPPWDFRVFDQMNRRLLRQGQESDTVFVSLIEARGTIERRVCRQLASKERTEAGLKGALTKERV